MKKINDMETIEERAYKAVPDMLRINDNYVASFVSGYCQGAEEQRKIDEEENGKALLYAVNKTAERTRKEVIEKACKWLKKELNKIAMKDVKDDFCRNTFKIIMKDQVPMWIDGLKKAMEQ